MRVLEAMLIYIEQLPQPSRRIGMNLQSGLSVAETARRCKVARRDVREVQEELYTRLRTIVIEIR